MSKHYFTIEFDTKEGFNLMPNTNPEPTEVDIKGAEVVEGAIKLLNLMFKKDN